MNGDSEAGRLTSELQTIRREGDGLKKELDMKNAALERV